MKRANKLNINSADYWNGIYKGTQKREEYRKNEKGLSRHQTTNRFLNALSEVKNGDEVLDIGCGIGTFTKLVKETYPDCGIVGTDISDAVIDENIAENNDITYQVAEIGKGDYFSIYDIVFSGEVIEHLDNPNILFKEAYKALKVGGKLIITTPRENTIPVEEHTWFFNEADIEKLYKENGFKDVSFSKLADNEHLFIIFAVGIKE